MSLKMFAIPNCDTVKKARKWLEDNGMDYDFHDYKKHGVPAEVIAEACEKFGWEQVLNRKGLTWRRMTDAEKDAVKGEKEAVMLMRDKPSIIKRPLVTQKGKPILLGFTLEDFEDTLL